VGRETVLLVVAVVIATLGASLVYLYVRGVDQRATPGEQLLPSKWGDNAAVSALGIPTKGSR